MLHCKYLYIFTRKWRGPESILCGRDCSFQANAYFALSYENEQRVNASALSLMEAFACTEAGEGGSVQIGVHH